MATIQCSLSAKIDKVTRKSEVMIRFCGGANIVARGKSGIFVKKEWLSDARGKFLKDAITDKERHKAYSDLEALKEAITTTFEGLKTASDNFPKDWLTVCIDKFHHPEKYEVIDVQERMTFFELWELYIATYHGSQRRIDHLNVILRALRRYEAYKRITFNIDTFSKEDVAAFKSFLQIEHTFFEECPENPTKFRPKRKYARLYEICPENRIPKERSENRIIDMLKYFKTFWSWANKNGYTSNRPFENYEIGTCKYGTPFYLTIEERDTLYNFNFRSMTRLAVQRDIFIFHCSVGCRVGDLMRLTKDNIVNGCLEYVASKTKDENPKTISVPLCRVAMEIVEKYADYDGNKLFPFISEQRYNDNIKKMLEVAGITRKVTILDPKTRREKVVPIYEVASSHMARRSFVGNLYKKLKDPNIVCEMSGHAPGSRAFARYRTIDDEIKREAITAIMD